MNAISHVLDALSTVEVKNIITGTFAGGGFLFVACLVMFI